MTRTARTEEFVPLTADIEELRQAAIMGLDAGIVAMLDPKRLEQVANNPEIQDAIAQYMAVTARLARMLGLDTTIDGLLDDLEDV
jgi:hypothetical protein